jgi:NADH-quinone oxidoreductase subunit E
MSSGRIPVPRFGHGSRVPGWDEAVDLTKDPAVVPDPATNPVPDELRTEIEAAMARYPDRRSAAIPALHAAQALHGWCSPEAIDQVATVMQLTPAYLTSVATFYDMLESTPRPPHNDVYVCTNISCSLLGADELFDAMVGAAGGHESVHVSSFECLGACDIAPMASVNGEYVGPLVNDDAAQIIEDLRAGRPVLREKQIRYRRSADPSANADSSTPDGHEFGTPDHPHRADTAGLGGVGGGSESEAATDRPGPSAPIEIPPELPRDDT